jgi:hypothetical protein
MITTPGASPTPATVVDHQRVAAESEPAHDPTHHLVIVSPIDAGDADTGRCRHDRSVAAGLLDQAMQDLLDLQLAMRLQVGAAAAALADDGAARVGEIAHRLRASGIDAEHVHIPAMLHSRVSRAGSH